jgi:hypothetical protein
MLQRRNLCLISLVRNVNQAVELVISVLHNSSPGTTTTTCMHLQWAATVLPDHQEAILFPLRVLKLQRQPVAAARLGDHHHHHSPPLLQHNSLWVP